MSCSVISRNAVSGSRRTTARDKTRLNARARADDFRRARLDRRSVTLRLLGFSQIFIPGAFAGRKFASAIAAETALPGVFWTVELGQQIPGFAVDQPRHALAWPPRCFQEHQAAIVFDYDLEIALHDVGPLSGNGSQRLFLARLLGGPGFFLGRRGDGRRGREQQRENDNQSHGVLCLVGGVLAVDVTDFPHSLAESVKDVLFGGRRFLRPGTLSPAWAIVAPAPSYVEHGGFLVQSVRRTLSLPQNGGRVAAVHCPTRADVRVGSKSAIRRCRLRCPVCPKDGVIGRQLVDS